MCAEREREAEEREKENEAQKHFFLALIFETR